MRDSILPTRVAKIIMRNSILLIRYSTSTGDYYKIASVRIIMWDAILWMQNSVDVFTHCGLILKSFASALSCSRRRRLVSGMYGDISTQSRATSWQLRPIAVAPRILEERKKMKLIFSIDDVVKVFGNSPLSLDANLFKSIFCLCEIKIKRNS